MFQSARIKLTAWYLLIIMLISISFSFAMYRLVSNELNRIRSRQRLRILNRINDEIFPYGQLPNNPRADTDLLDEAQARLITILVLANVAILVTSTTAGYFLAGKTLKPIKNMVDEQNQFISDASHELRTPLTSLRSEIEVNLRDKNLNLDAARKILKSNLEEVQNLQALTDKLIRLSKFEKVGDSKEMEIVSWGEMAKVAVKKVEKLAEKKNISIINRTKNGKFLGERESLTELVVILLDNAIKYSANGTKVTISSLAHGPQTMLSVKDEGRGIKKEDQKHLFDRFYRADKARSKNGQDGYGLGLAIARQIIKRHNGEISFESKLQKGSTFNVKIPTGSKA